MVKWIKKRVTSFLLRNFASDVRELQYTSLTVEQKDGMFATMWEFPSFRNYFIRRETDLVRAMSDVVMKPSDDDYMILYGRRLELMELHNEARDAYNRNFLRKKNSSLAQAKQPN